MGMSHKGKMPVRPTTVLPNRENIHGLYEKYPTISCHEDHASVPPRMSYGKNPASVQLGEHAYDAAAMFVVACSSPSLFLSQDPRVNASRNAKIDVETSRLLVNRPWKLCVDKCCKAGDRIVSLFPELTSPRRTGSRYNKAYTVSCSRKMFIANDDARRSPDYDTGRDFGAMPSSYVPMCVYIRLRVVEIRPRDDGEKSWSWRWEAWKNRENDRRATG